MLRIYLICTDTYLISVYSEERSDECISNVLGLSGAAKCYMPSDCLDVISEPGYDEYSLTHQILYTLVVQQVCMSIMVDWHSI